MLYMCMYARMCTHINISTARKTMVRDNTTRACHHASYTRVSMRY